MSARAALIWCDGGPVHHDYMAWTQIRYSSTALLSCLFEDSIVRCSPPSPQQLTPEWSPNTADAVCAQIQTKVLIKYMQLERSSKVRCLIFGLGMKGLQQSLVSLKSWNAGPLPVSRHFASPSGWKKAHAYPNFKNREFTDVRNYPSDHCLAFGGTSLRRDSFVLY